MEHELSMTFVMPGKSFGKENSFLHESRSIADPMPLRKMGNV
jgi:hypothetical protein